MQELLKRKKLLNSDIVANNRMNRERRCSGGNSYRKELSFDPIRFLEERLKTNKSSAWLDICCGEGRALIEAASFFADKYSHDASLTNRLNIIGIDLAGMFRKFSSELKHLNLLEIPVEDFHPKLKFDLITCVHGMHYIGDKLSIIQKAASWLKTDGVFLANLDLNNLKLAGKQNSNRTFSAFLRRQQFTFENKKHLLILMGGKNLELSFDYIGADDKAGPNYTKQPVVDSYYRRKNIVTE